MTLALFPSPASVLLTDPTVWGAVVVTYLLGSIPFGLLLAKWVRGVDLREIGSGNIGATNAVRAMGHGWGMVVFALDFLKGFAPVFLSQYLTSDADLVSLLQVACGTAAVLGHCYSAYLGFKGGKGVATGCGAIVAIDPIVFVGGGLVWLLVRFTTRYLGLASILMGCTFPVLAWVHGGRREVIIASCLLMLLILVRHRSNISRMLAGTEPRAGAKTAATHTDKTDASHTAGHHG